MWQQGRFDGRLGGSGTLLYESEMVEFVCCQQCSSFLFNFVRLCSVGVLHHYSHFKQDEYLLRDHVLVKHYKLRSDKIYIISNVEHTVTLFTRTKQILHLITDNLQFSSVMLKPVTPLSWKTLNSLEYIIN